MKKKVRKKKMNSFMVLGLKVPIKYAHDLHLDGSWVFGYYCFDKREIYLNLDQEPDSMRRTLLHELGHALFDRIGIRVAVSSEIMEVLTEGFANFFDDNFKLLP